MTRFRVWFHDESRRARLVLRALSWEGFVHVSLDEIRHWSIASIQVTRRLSAVLEDLLSIAPEERRPVLVRQQEMLRAAAANAFEVTDEGAWAVEPDQQGVGSGRRRILQAV